MKWPTFVCATVLTVGLTGCGFFGGDEEETPAATQEVPAVDSSAQAAAELEEAPPLEQEPAPAASTTPVAPAREASPPPVRTAVDQPWTPTHTGTIDPGMTRSQVIAVWGEPLVERDSGGWLYLYYRNGCEVTCGMNDVVLLQDGQVVDAVVRGRGHIYSGVSSSPAGREAVPTPPSREVG